MSKQLISKEELRRLITDWFIEQDDFCHEQDDGMVCIDGWYEIDNLALTIQEKLDEREYEKSLESIDGDNK